MKAVVDILKFSKIRKYFFIWCQKILHHFQEIINFVVNFHFHPILLGLSHLSDLLATMMYYYAYGTCQKFPELRLPRLRKLLVSLFLSLGNPHTHTHSWLLLVHNSVFNWHKKPKRQAKNWKICVWPVNQRNHSMTLILSRTHARYQTFYVHN